MQLPLQLGGRDREQEHAHARPSVRRFSRREHALEAGLAAARDHRGGEARHRHRRLRRPARAGRRDDDRGRAHVESFGERVVDGDAVDRQRAHATASNGCGRPTAPSGTRMKSDWQPVARVVIFLHSPLHRSFDRGRYRAARGQTECASPRHRARRDRRPCRREPPRGTFAQYPCRGDRARHRRARLGRDGRDREGPAVWRGPRGSSSRSRSACIRA